MFSQLEDGDFVPGGGIRHEFLDRGVGFQLATR
jgi:hypothetical protein